MSGYADRKPAGAGLPRVAVTENRPVATIEEWREGGDFDSPEAIAAAEVVVLAVGTPNGALGADRSHQPG
jgi:hypothetical protein